jgi:hypothetical protein
MHGATMKTFLQSYGTFCNLTALFCNLTALFAILRHFLQSHSTFCNLTALFAILRHCLQSHGTFCNLTALFAILRQFLQSYGTFLVFLTTEWNRTNFLKHTNHRTNSECCSNKTGSLWTGHRIHSHQEWLVQNIRNRQDQQTCVRDAGRHPTLLTEKQKNDIEIVIPLKQIQYNVKQCMFQHSLGEESVQLFALKSTNVQ